jgi:hypothetical protein
LNNISVGAFLLTNLSDRQESLASLRAPKQTPMVVQPSRLGNGIYTSRKILVRSLGFPGLPEFIEVEIFVKIAWDPAGFAEKCFIASARRSISML